MSDENQQVNGAEVVGGDLNELDPGPANEGRKMEVVNGLGEVLRHADGRPFTITLLGMDGSVAQQLLLAQADSQRERFNRTRRLDSAKMSDNQQLDLLVALTKNMDIVLNGAPVEQNKEAYRKVYAAFNRLRKQADDFAGNPANFLRTSSQS